MHTWVVFMFETFVQPLIVLQNPFTILPFVHTQGGPVKPGKQAVQTVVDEQLRHPTIWLEHNTHVFSTLTYVLTQTQFIGATPAKVQFFEASQVRHVLASVPEHVKQVAWQARHWE